MKAVLFSLVLAGLVIFGCSEDKVLDNEGFSSSSSGEGNQTVSGSSGGSDNSSDSSDSGETSSSGTSNNSNDSSSSGDSDNSSDSSSSGGSNNSSSSSGGNNTNSSSSGNGSLPSSSSPLPNAGNYPRLQEGQSGVTKGWGSRYWDGCKPHCSLPKNVNENAVPYTICRNCDINNKEIPTFTLSPDIEVRYDQWAGTIFEDWLGYKETVSSCQDGGIAYACWDMAPIALNDTLAYAFVAASPKDACGQCFQIQFDGGNHGDDVKEAHRLIAGKTLIVMVTNTGDDVEEGQFDIMVPGGGPGMFNSFATQMGVSQGLLGEGYGGLLTTCQQEIHDYDKPASVFQDCVRNKCNAVFSNPKHKMLLDGCLWFVDWYKTADNPTFLSKETECPKYFTDKYPSTINTASENRIEPYGGFKKNIPDGYEYDRWIW